MKKIKALYFLSLLFTTSIAHAFQEDLGSAYKKNYTNYKVSDSIFPKSFWNSESVKITFVPTIFFGSTAITWNGREHILETRNKYIPEFANTFDDYLQYAPGALAFGLKASGVNGRNNIRRSVYNYAGSMLITGIFVNSLKYSTKVMRPDGSTANSWPSGHAATAFANAAFLDKEYGLVNPSYSITGYGMAIITGIGRSMNNRHWSPDILAGAGFGILSTNLAYFFIDKIYGNKGDNLSFLSKIEGNETPSFLAVRLGASFNSNNILKFHNDGPEAKIGWEAGFEGAYFFTKSIGIGGEFTISGYPLAQNNTNKLEASDTFEQYNLSTVNSALGFMNAGIGPYYAFHFSSKFNMMLKATIGYSFGASGKIEAKQNDTDIFLPVNILDDMTISSYKPHSSFRWSTGTAFTYNITDQLGLSLYADYSTTKPTIRYTPGNPQLNSSNNKFESNKADLHYLSTGLRLTAYF
ncbi:phosphatase PAP2 family protein [Myroides sp. DF42-4-2]|uniref:phosphatase PAP2 family protein n=1 Tax=Myroides sp. DF42-4-2 TaxID=2746726 RepID=UPI0025751C76|nr:phosphatase PAP2 family protein [Myroides sp. DF42-4-2]MDM1408212.1 phosphatase PAP2 family protein [Myroides sp. DF42-4-2]